MIFIRADANEIIGTGHVMRCISIANAFRNKGEEVTFVTADHRGDGLIRQAGYTSVCMNSEWTLMESELTELIRLVKEKKPSLLLVDSYYVTGEYFDNLSPQIRTAYIDDMNQQLWNVDYLINYNIFAEVFDYSQYAVTRTELMLNPSFAPLREEFKNLSKHEIKEQAAEVMISAGGADPEGISGRIIREICPVWPEASFHFIVGALNPRVDELKELEGNNIILHINERHMSELMKRCDISVSAAGTTLYELCACGIPTITYTLADNQLVAAEQFEKQHIMSNAGDCRDNRGFIAGLNDCIGKLISSKELRKDMSEQMQNLVDGNGADRIAAHLLN